VRKGVPEVATREGDVEVIRHGLSFKRYFTKEGVHPFDEIEWEVRDAVIPNYKEGGNAFEQRGVEFPKDWSQNATNIVAQKYFRGPLGTPQRESSVRQLVSRVVDTIRGWGVKDGYFASEGDAQVFADELSHLIVTQKAAFNSPVWFNVGVPDTPQQCSACFILAVEDTMTSILNWYVEEGIIFKGGSGSGVNLSKIRSSKEALAGGGTASGPVSFMRGADASAGTIKSGGKTRRAAKMVVLNVDHPDIRDFIWCKAVEERKARALRDAGFDMDLDGKDSYSIQYQNANNSVRVTDEFMQAYLDDRDWKLKAVLTGETIETVRTRELMREIAQAAWECADPGMQYDTTINEWHTCPASGRINASNPCFTGDMRVHTDKGLVRFDEMVRRVTLGETFEVYTYDATNPDRPRDSVSLSKPTQLMVTGVNEILRLRFTDGRELRCTPNHHLWTTNRGWVRADEVSDVDEIPFLDQATPAVMADHRLPVATDWRAYAVRGDRSRALELPEKWDEDLAHYVGWLVGDGSISGNVVTTIYGSKEDQEEILPRHLELLTGINGGRAPKPSVQENGTVQLRLSRRPLARFFEALGVKRGRAATKGVPWSIFEAPQGIVRAFLRGLFDADGCAADLSNGTRYVGLGSKSEELLRGVQMLLASLGISSRIYDVTGNSHNRKFSYTRKRDGRSVGYESRGRSFDLRLFGENVLLFLGIVGFSLARKEMKLALPVQNHTRYGTGRGTRLSAREPDGFEVTYNLTEPLNHSYIVQGVAVANCSEYMHLDNSACNLASLNLMKFLDEEGNFDIAAFKHAVEVVFTAQEVIVGNSDYPTEKIERNARAFRQLGLGYANLGALLMARGLPYDSDAGRAWAGAITALMTGHAYATSARIAEVTGPFAGFSPNRDAMLRVMRKHRAAADRIDPDLVPEGLLTAAKSAWDEAVALGERHGYRNAQASVLAPTGTIGLMLDCDTTGIEPDLALVKQKKLVGGGTMRIVNQTVPRALIHLGYTEEQAADIVNYIAEHNSVEGAPHLRSEHEPVFDTSMGERAIHYMGHVRMMAAVQPFISGAISKCVTGDTLLTTEDGLIRIGGLYEDETPDTFRDHVMAVASLDGRRKTDAFYYGGVRPVRQVVLRSGHRVVGTHDHRVLVADEAGLTWRRLDEIRPGEYVAVQYGAEMWAVLPPRFGGFTPTERYGCQKAVRIPEEMTPELAFLLGAFAAEGHVTRSNWTVTITNADEGVLERVAEAWRSEFGVEPRVLRQPGKCPGVAVSSKTIVEFLEWLGCGTRASTKRIPDAVLRSPRAMVLAFLQGLALDAYAVRVGESPKWAICVESPGLLDDLQAVLTNLGVVHSRIEKANRANGKRYGEVYATGEHAEELMRLAGSVEQGKRERARTLLDVEAGWSSADVVPGIAPRDLYELIPRGKSGRDGYGERKDFGFLLHFSPVERVEDAGEREVFDISVPERHAFVGNGIVNHNTVNMPEEATVDEVEQLFVEGWRLGLKAIAIYRNNCKVAQPLSAEKKAKDRAEEPAAVPEPVRRRLPMSRPSKTISFQVGDAEGYITAGEYPDDGIGEIFLKVSKQGSTLSGIMDAFAIAVSLGLQYGVPLEAFAQKFVNMKFEPSGITNDPDIRLASSLVDYIFRRLALEYLPPEKRETLGIRSLKERKTLSTGGNGQPREGEAPSAEGGAEPRVETIVPSAQVADAPLCYSCGSKMQPAGSCYVCPTCGSTSGCS